VEERKKFSERVEWSTTLSIDNSRHEIYVNITESETVGGRQNGDWNCSCH